MEKNAIIAKYNEYRKKIRSLEYALKVISFDGATGAPKSGIEERSETMGMLSLEYFNCKTSDEFASIIADLEKVKAELDPMYQRIVEIERKNLDKIKKIPPQRYQEYSVLTSQAEVVWEEAKEKNDYQLFKPYLEKLVNFMKEFATYYGGPIEGSLYNRLLDDYEEGMTTVKLDKFFGTLKDRIVPLLKKITESKVVIDDSFVYKKYPHDKQLKLSTQLLDLIGFDLSRGMLRESAHPFTNDVSNSDVRVTTHILENNLVSNIYSVIHEGGHGIYGQNINPEYKGTILYDGASMAVHESQSRFYENVVGRSKEFVEMMYPKLKKLFPTQLKDVSLEQLYLAINKVEPSLIRTEADELTYSLHIIIRYEIEKMLIDGNINFDDLPKIWNDKMKEYLGIEPSSDSQGVLQDIHWAGGSFGYFPSYALGNAIGLQIVNTMKRELDYKQIILSNDLTPIKEWLSKNVYIYGSMYSPDRLVKIITGEELNANYFCDYLEAKFGDIYKVK
jgi:carboxypeptidase Taq